MFDFEKVLEKVEYNIILGGRNKIESKRAVDVDYILTIMNKSQIECLQKHYKKVGETVECNDGRANNWYFED